MVELILERVVHAPAQRIDVAYVPKVRDPRLGVMDRMTALGPGMFEYFASPPSRAAVKECLRKRMNFEHELAQQAQHHGKQPRQWLWILSAGRPREVLREHGAVPMKGWPVGFTGALATRLGKVEEMDPYQQALKVYREYEQRIRLDEAQRVRQEEARRFELETQRLRQEEARRNLTRLLTRRFGALSEELVARVEQAEHAQLEGWMDRVLTAQSIDDVFA